MSHIPNTNKNIQFEQISLRQSTAIILPQGDTISNSTAGTIDMSGSDLLASHFIPVSNDTNPGNTYFVSPGFFENVPALRNYQTITSALNAIPTNDSATIIVFEGTYSEALTAKSDVSIIGVSADKVKITSNSNSTISISGISNFELKNLTIENTGNAKGACCINIGGTDAVTSNVNFENLVLINSQPASETYIINCNNSPFYMINCFLKAENIGGTCTNLINLTNASKPVIYSCRFINQGATVATNSICINDENTDIIIGYSQNYTGGYFIYNNIIGGSQPTGRSFNNVSNAADYQFTNLIVSPNNIVDANFIIR